MHAGFRRSDVCCWTCSSNWTQLHHILSRAHGGDDVTVNLAPLCTSCHHLVEARDSVTRSLLRGALMPSNLEYLRFRLGENVAGWLERNYAATPQSEGASV